LIKNKQYYLWQYNLLLIDKIIIYEYLSILFDNIKELKQIFKNIRINLNKKYRQNVNKVNIVFFLKK
tara:strand:+ start:392 stop:592 length:201 start_codon:yes stop_codon:yes gene_type:complete